MTKELGYKDIRAVRQWCRKNNILVIKTGRIEFVLESAFKEAFERPFIEKLRKDFGNDWEAAYNVYADGNIPALNTLQKIPEVKFKTFVAKDPLKEKYVNQFKQYANEKAS
ncbi:MAG: hypothetical protein V4565_08965 [Bacteroidota bacterium]